MSKIKKIKIFVQLFILASFLCFFFIFAFSQLNTINTLDSEIASLENDIKSEELTNEKLQNELGYSQSDEFIEKVARERLGLIKYDEILFLVEQ